MKQSFKVKLVPIHRITSVLRRSSRVSAFNDLVNSISSVGLKRPIIVSPRKCASSNASYDLVCGYRRLRACIKCGMKRIPAIIVYGSPQTFMLMSLAENMARYKPDPMNIFKHIEILRKNGCDNCQIARKLGLEEILIQGIERLFNRGEEQLLSLVLSKQIPIGIALAIASDNQANVHDALTEAHDSGIIGDTDLQYARHLFDERCRVFDAWVSGMQCNANGAGIIRKCNKRGDQLCRRKMALKKYERLFHLIRNSIEQLCEDKCFVLMLKQEGLDNTPKILLALQKNKL